MKFEWDEKVVSSRFWDVDACNGKGEEFRALGTLKEQITNYGQMKFEDSLRNCTIAISMLMAHIERLTKENEELKDNRNAGRVESSNPPEDQL